MSQATQDGGPAFPSAREEYDLDNNRWRTVSDDGMTLRDYFAAKAVQSFIGGMSTEYGAKELRRAMTASALTAEQIAAKFAYAYADAMLKARTE